MQNPNKGELSREVSESCFEYRIPPTSHLYDLLINGRFEMKKYTNVYLLNALPTMIQEGNTKYIVFSHCGKGSENTTKTVSVDNDQDLNEQGADSGPSLYFYDLIDKKEVMRIQGGEALIDYTYDKNSEDRYADKLMFLGNKEIMSNRDLYSRKICKMDAEIYVESAIPERKTAIVVSLKLRISEEAKQNYELWPTKDNCLIQQPTKMRELKYVPNHMMSDWIPH